jgi:hypothetical protein
MNIERLDERDVILRRVLMLPGSEEYKAYYSMHPQLEERDEKLRSYVNPFISMEIRKRTFPEKQMTSLLAPDDMTVALFLADKVDGFVAPNRVDMNPVKMTRLIKGYAHQLGADLVGIAELNENWVYSHRGGAVTGSDKWGAPIELNHKYAIVMAYAMHWEFISASRAPSLVTRVDVQSIYDHMAFAAVRMAAYIRRLGYAARAQIVSNYQVLLVPIAVDAGLGELGRMGYLLTKEFGPAERLVAITTDLPLIPDQHTDIGIQDFCEKCKKCVMPALPVLSRRRKRSSGACLKGR